MGFVFVLMLVGSLLNFKFVRCFRFHSKSFKIMNLVNQPLPHPFMRSLVTNMARMSISDVLKNPEWPEKFPFDAEDFTREDQTVDSNFYYQPRFVTHIDDYAIKALTDYYGRTIKPNTSILDICSSWISHYPKDLKFSRACGMGMNAEELKQNTQLSEYVVQDLNMNPVFPYPDNTFDYVTCVVSVDYLIRPLEVFSEIRRVLRPGGRAIISQSNRCFPTKAINIWLNTNDLQHIYIVGSYFHYAGGYKAPESFDISPAPGWTSRSDPMYIVTAVKA